MALRGNKGSGNTVERDLWQTPQELSNTLDCQYKFGTDCCALEHNTKCDEYFDDFEKDSRWCPASIADPRSESSCYWAENAIKEHCLDKKFVLEAIENLKISYREEITSKHSTDEERVLYNIKLQTLEELEIELSLEGE